MRPLLCVAIHIGGQRTDLKLEFSSILTPTHAHHGTLRASVDHARYYRAHSVPQLPDDLPIRIKAIIPTTKVPFSLRVRDDTRESC